MASVNPNYCYIGKINFDFEVYLVCTLVVACGALLEKFLVRRIGRTSVVRPFMSVLHHVTAVITPIPVVIFLYRASQVNGNMAPCLPFTVDHCLTLVINIFFLLRLFVVTLEGCDVDNLAVVVDIWLFLQAVGEIMYKVHLYGYEFLVLFRLIYPNTRALYSQWLQHALGNRVREVVFLAASVVLGGLVAAGAMQIAEEWQGDAGTHTDSGGQVTLFHGFGDYLYMAFVTVSTVGYGDMTPSTDAAKIVVVMTIIGFVPWFATICECVQELMRDQHLFNFLTNSLPDLNREQRVVVLGCRSPKVLHKFLKDFRRREPHCVSTQVIVLLEKNCKLELSDFQTGKSDSLLWNSFVLMKEIKPEIFKELFPLHSDTSTERPNDRIIILSDRKTREMRELDDHVFNLVHMVKRAVPTVTVVIQVLMSDTRQAVECVDGWSELDTVVCLQDITTGLMAHNVVAEGAAALLSNIVSPTVEFEDEIPFLLKIAGFQDFRKRHHHECLDWLLDEFYYGEEMALSFAKEDLFDYDETFAQAAIRHYLSDRTILLGYYNQHGHHCLLPPHVPAGTRRTLVAHTSLNSKVNEVTIEPKRVPVSSSKQTTAHFSVHSPKTVCVLKEDPHLVHKLKQYDHLDVVAVDGETSPSTVAFLGRPNERMNNIYDLHLAKAMLMESQLPPKFVTNVKHTPNEGIRTLLQFSRHSCHLSVNESVFMSAVTQAFLSPELHAVWTDIVVGNKVVLVEVVGHIRYVEALKILAEEHGLLAIGMVVETTTYMCDECLNEFDTGTAQWLPILNPSPEVTVYSTDTIIALRFG